MTARKAPKELMDLLNQAVAREIQVSVQYMWQHVLWKGVKGFAVKDALKKIAIEEGAKFSIIDTSLHPEIISQFDIKELPAVMIGKNTYRIEENTIRSAIRKEKI